jgi:hypothetical protein
MREDTRVTIEGPFYSVNEHEAVIMTAAYEQGTIDLFGRCCGRKPIAYKRPSRFFCPRCDREYAPDGKQVANWAFKRRDDGLFELAKPVGYSATWEGPKTP